MKIWRVLIAFFMLISITTLTSGATYGSFPYDKVVTNEGNSVGGQYEAYEYISLQYCIGLCETNPLCNSFAYNTRDHCALKDRCLDGSEAYSNIGSNYRTYYRIPCRSILPTTTPTMEPTGTFDPSTHNIYTAVDEWLNNPTSAASTYGNITTWNTTGITDMSNLFSHNRNNLAINFNEFIGSWDVSSVTDMGYMFYIASTFNQPLDSWDV